jgi:ornithine carbamoyltransferase
VAPPWVTLIAALIGRVTPRKTLHLFLSSSSLTSTSMKPPHLITLADLSAAQINRFLIHSHNLKRTSLPLLRPFAGGKKPEDRTPGVSKALRDKSIALIFSKRSTRTRLAAETSTNLLGGNALFLAPSDIQLGVNESFRDSSRVIGGMCQGIFARVGKNAEIVELAKYSPVPVLNALCDLWHPTQILADLLTLREHAHRFTGASPMSETDELPELPPLTITWLGDSTNVLHDILVAFPRLNPGNRVRVAVPPKQEYQCPTPVWDRVKQLGIERQIHWCSDPREAVHGANIVVTDTWYVSL